MTLGAGIVWSTVLVLIALAIWQITKNKRWRTVGKVFGVVVLFGLLIGGGFWAWAKYQDRPQVVTKLAGVTIGMSETDVTLALGKPDRQTLGLTDGHMGPLQFAYADEFDNEILTLIYFDGKNAEIDAGKVERVCKFGGLEPVLGFSTASNERSIVEKLGVPANVSIHEDGLKKLISYPKWKAAYIIEKGKVNGVCISTSGIVKFGKKYGEGPPTPTGPWQKYRKPESEIANE